MCLVQTDAYIEVKDHCLGIYDGFLMIYYITSVDISNIALRAR
jgi:hypothetical protein